MVTYPNINHRLGGLSSVIWQFIVTPFLLSHARIVQMLAIWIWIKMGKHQTLFCFLNKGIIGFPT